MEIEILSGRFNFADTVAARGDFNGWMRHDLIPDPFEPNIYISEFPDLIYGVQVGEPLVEYKFFYTPNVWETGDNRIHILTQEEYNAGVATISRAFNDATLATVTNQETTIQFTVDCNGAVSAITNQPFPGINTCHIAGGTPPLQWPSGGWPNGDIGLMIPLFDDGTNGDPIAGDKIYNVFITFPAFTPFEIHYKYGINYGDNVNNGGGNDNEATIGANHIIELSQYLVSAQVENVFGTMGYHTLTNMVFVPVELTSFTAQLNDYQVLLHWQTSTETNNHGFEIQRRLTQSNSVSEWTTIGFKEGHGTTTEPQYYSFIDDISGMSALSWTYRLKQIDYNGSFEYSKEVTVENCTVPDKYSLTQNYPNPFNPSTTIEFDIPEKGLVNLTIYDLLGNEVKTLVNKEMNAGSHKVVFNAIGLTSGVYIYKVIANTFTQTKKMILMK
jgi:hypothetical protein